MKLIRISASWCVSCIITKKDWDEIKTNYEYEEYDYDFEQDKVKEFNVGNILPIIIVFKDNKEITRIIGEKNKKQILEIIGEVE